MNVPKEDWTESIRGKRRAQTIRARTFIFGIMTLWLLLSALGVWAWVSLFHRFPPERALIWYIGLSSTIIVWLGAFAPLAPMKGKDPEVIAADEFFRDPSGQ